MEPGHGIWPRRHHDTMARCHHDAMARWHDDAKALSQVTIRFSDLSMSPVVCVYVCSGAYTVVVSPCMYALYLLDGLPEIHL